MRDVMAVRRAWRQGLAAARSAGGTVAGQQCDSRRRDFGMADPTRLKRAAMQRWLAGCCAVGVSLILSAHVEAITATPAPAVTTFVDTTDAAPGANLTLTWSVVHSAG